MNKTKKMDCLKSSMHHRHTDAREQLFSYVHKILSITTAEYLTIIQSRMISE